ncbi:MAG: hypothetical protein JST12_18645 [Armatimonadetes bacterium]|nr:hypothetical protein [Armatimonadota bacterium]
MKTFERVHEGFAAFLSRIVSTSPDVIVPVARKGCKLLRATAPEAVGDIPVLYRKHFELFPRRLTGLRVAVIDDATQYGSTLLEYRQFFEKRGAIVSTYSYVGHESLNNGERLQHDAKAIVGVFLTEPLYQEYILQQSEYLLSTSSHFDLDHLVFKLDLDESQFRKFQDSLSGMGILLPISDSTSPYVRFVLSNPIFFNSSPYLRHESISLGSIRKIKFMYDSSTSTLYWSPLVFPTWRYGKCPAGSHFIPSAPIDLPFPQEKIRLGNSSKTLERQYFNIQLLAKVSLAKAFVQELAMKGYRYRENGIKWSDFDSVLGASLAKSMNQTIESFLMSNEFIEFFEPRFEETDLVDNGDENLARVSSYAKLIDYLRRQYLKKTKKRRARTGVHYYVPYEEFFRSGVGNLLVSSDFDRLCDLGALVPSTIRLDGAFVRACRTGEVNPDIPWDRTHAIIPIAIEQIAYAQGKAESEGIKAMALDKVLACFVYDFPTDLNQQLHCVTGRPHTFGSLVRLSHPVRAHDDPTLYFYAKGAPFCRFHKQTNSFFIKNRLKLTMAIDELFDEKQEVPFTELVAYFGLLGEISTMKGGVEKLNTLSICREENYFYNHVHYNLRAWVSHFFQGIGAGSDDIQFGSVHDAATEVASARIKLKMPRGLDGLFEQLDSRFAGDLRYVKAYQRLKKNRFPFDAEFGELLVKLEQIAEIQSVVSRYVITAAEGKEVAQKKLKGTNWKEILESAGIAKAEDLDECIVDWKVVERGASTCKDLIAELPRPEKLLSTRLRKYDTESARKRLFQWMGDARGAVALVHIDLTGSTKIPDPRDHVLSEFCNLLDMVALERGGHRIYGTHGGDDAHTFVFRSGEAAFRFTKDVRAKFDVDLFFQGLGVKFGMATGTFSLGYSEQALALLWKDARKCCEMDVVGFVNRNLVVSESTWNDLVTLLPAKELNRAEELGTLTGRGVNYYYFTQLASPA